MTNNVLLLPPEIQEFIYSRQKNGWVTVETPKTNVEIYIRKAKRIIYDEQYHRNYDIIDTLDTLDLATWNADKPKHGGMTFILNNLEKATTPTPFQALYIENLTIPAVGAYLLHRREGWKECYGQVVTTPGIYCRSFYYWLGNKKRRSSSSSSSSYYS